MPKRGKRNEPAFVGHTAAVVAEVKGIPVDELAARTTENFLRLFNRMPAPAS
jgi:TatD DNase family protein